MTTTARQQHSYTRGSPAAIRQRAYIIRLRGCTLAPNLIIKVLVSGAFLNVRRRLIPALTAARLI
jgi:hypothetical protein